MLIFLRCFLFELCKLVVGFNFPYLILLHWKRTHLFPVASKMLFLGYWLFYELNSILSGKEQPLLISFLTVPRGGAPGYIHIL